MAPALPSTPCRVCGYTLAGLPAATRAAHARCPECGTLQPLTRPPSRGWGATCTHWSLSVAALCCYLVPLAVAFIVCSYVWFHHGDVQEFGFPMNTLGGWMFMAAFACIALGMFIASLLIGRLAGMSGRTQVLTLALTFIAAWLCGWLPTLAFPHIVF